MGEAGNQANSYDPYNYRQNKPAAYESAYVAAARASSALGQPPADIPDSMKRVGQNHPDSFMQKKGN